MIVQNSIQGRRARVNAESLLAFNGVNQYANAGNNTNLNALDVNKDFALCYWVNLKTTVSGQATLFDKRQGNKRFGLRIQSNFLRFDLSDGINARSFILQKAIQANNYVFVAINYLSNNKTISARINTVELATSIQDVGNSPAINSIVNTAPLFIGGVSNGYANVAINHLTFFNRTLTETEIKLIHRPGGYLPQSTHAACVAHYVTDRQGMKLWDVVGQYNYAKQIRRLSQVDAEFLTGHTWGLGEGFSIANGKLIFSGASGGRGASVTFTGQTLQFVADSIELTVVVNSYSNSSGSTAGFIGIQYGTGTGNELIIKQSGSYTAQLNYLGDGGSTPIRVRSGRGDDRFEIESITIKHATNPELEAHHATLQNFTPQQVDTAGGTQSAYLDFYDKTILRPFVDSNSDGIPDQPLKETSSLLPPLRNALKFDGATQYASVANFNPTGQKGYTIIVSFEKPITLDGFKGILVSRGTGTFFIGGNNNGSFDIFFFSSSATVQFVFPGKDLLNINQLILAIEPSANTTKLVSFYLNGRLLQKKNVVQLNDFSTINSALRIGDDAGGSNRKISASFASVGIAKGIITHRQVIELWNNSLLANPKSHWRNLEWQLLPTLNEIHYTSFELPGGTSKQVTDFTLWNFSNNWSATPTTLSYLGTAANSGGGRFATVTIEMNSATLSGDSVDVSLRVSSYSSPNSQGLSVRIRAVGQGNGPIKAILAQDGMYNFTLVLQPGFKQYLVEIFAYNTDVQATFNISDLTVTQNFPEHRLLDYSGQNRQIQLSGFTAPNLNPADPAYSLTEINSIR